MRKLMSHRVGARLEEVPPRPFPGKWPTRWLLEIRQDDEVYWSYIGKPSVVALLKFKKMVYAAKAKWRLELEIREFDRAGTFYTRSGVWMDKVQGIPFVQPPRDLDVWIRGARATSKWSVYHPFEPMGLGWIQHKNRVTLAMKTGSGPMRFYSHNFDAIPDWKAKYREVVLLAEQVNYA